MWATVTIVRSTQMRAEMAVARVALVHALLVNSVIWPEPGDVTRVPSVTKETRREQSLLVDLLFYFLSIVVEITEIS